MPIVESELNVGGSVEDSTLEAEPKKRRGRPPGSTNKATLEKLEKALAEKLVETVAPAVMLAPLTVMYWQSRAEQNAKALCVIASKNAAVRKGLQTFVDGSSIIALPITAVGMVVCIQIEFMGASPESIAARALQIDDLYMQIFPPSETSENGQPTHGIEPRGLMGDMQDA